MMRQVKAGTRSLPDFSEDEVVDYLVAEAVTIAATVDQKERDEEEAKKAERAKFRKGHRTMADDLAAGKLS